MNILHYFVKFGSFKCGLASLITYCINFIYVMGKNKESGHYLILILNIHITLLFFCPYNNSFV